MIAPLDNYVCSRTWLTRVAAQIARHWTAQGCCNGPLFVGTDAAHRVQPLNLNGIQVALLYSEPVPLKELESMSTQLHAAHVTHLYAASEAYLLDLARWHHPPQRLVLLNAPIWQEQSTEKRT